MSRWESLTKELPHYIVVLALAYVGLQVANVMHPTIPLWQEIVVALLIAVVYVLGVTRLGYAPESWYPGRNVDR